MHELRSAILSGENANYSPLSTKEGCRRQGSDRREASLSGLAIGRTGRRTTNQRTRERHREIVERLTILFRGKRTLVKVVNISDSGLMIESAIEPHIGEAMRIEFDGSDPIGGRVCWVKQGRIGIDVGEGTIVLGGAGADEAGAD